MEQKQNTQQKLKPGFGEKSFFIFVLFLSTGAFIWLFLKENGINFDPTRGNLVSQVMWSGIYTITFFLLIKHLRQVVKIAFHDKLLWLLVVLAIISVFWSENPVVTARRSMALLGTTAFGIYLAARCTRLELLRLLVLALGVSAVLSLGFVFLWPSYGNHHDIIAWRGIYDNRNALGCLMSLAAIAWLLYFFHDMKRNRVGFGFCCISMVLLVLTKSKTALLVFIILLFLLMVCHILRWRNIRGICAFSLAVLCVGIVGFYTVHHLDLVLAFLGRDVTLSKRTLLWEAVWDMIRQRPWTGYGYGAFWLDWKGPSAYIWHVLPFQPLGAHNGYLDVWLQLGFLGTGFLALSFLANLFKALVLLWREKSPDDLFALLFLAFLIMYNVSESMLLVQNSIFWILYVVISTQLMIEYEHRRLSQ